MMSQNYVFIKQWPIRFESRVFMQWYCFQPKKINVWHQTLSRSLHRGCGLGTRLDWDDEQKFNKTYKALARCIIILNIKLSVFSVLKFSWHNVKCCCCIVFFSYHYLMSMLLNDTITQYQHYSWDHIACGWYCLEEGYTKLTLSLLN